ncbi:hypothetical protein [Enterobacter sp. ODB01]|uniref:hypothetical protein n=1 Tax=Enterobacter sp. ODB01 TaxID=1827481 RepID=UPI000A674BCE|nr:hypothetical protein [Enterobacter sp. ODB01]
MASQNGQQHFMFVKIEGDNIPERIAKGNNKIKGYEDQIQIDNCVFEEANCTFENGQQYLSSSDNCHTIRFVGTSSKLGGSIDASFSNAFKQLSSPSLKKTTITLNYAQSINDQVETIKSIELTDVDITSIDSGMGGEALSSFNVVAKGLGGHITVTPYDEEGKAGSAETYHLTDLSTQVKGK